MPKWLVRMMVLNSEVGPEAAYTGVKGHSSGVKQPKGISYSIYKILEY